jgi:hypothetical protein
METTTTENGQTTKVKRQTKSYKTEFKKSQRDKYRMLVIALAGWSLAFVEFIIFLVVRSL